MKFVIITHVPHIIERNNFFAYAPYVNEMNVWAKDMKDLILVAPIVKSEKTLLDIAYEHKKIQFIPITSFDVLSLQNIVRSVFKIPSICWHIFFAMRSADHIHLRCPGNIGLLGCFIQVLFPNTPKTAKYAGNWDPMSKQPSTYKLQQWILNNTFLTRNMRVLVYGEWKGSSKNIKPFFTATYTEKDKVPLVPKKLNEVVDFVFVGALVKGKNPMYAIHLIENLYKKGYSVRLRMYGEGLERQSLEDYILTHQLETIISLKGNQTQEVVKKAYQESHFVILPSNSEGWPKAIAEGMFWGCVPLAPSVSCVPYMLDGGKRGVLLELNLEKDAEKTEMLLNNQKDLDAKSKNAAEWSRSYTLDVFEQEIVGLLKPDLNSKIK
ncbi:glycosyltransferase [Flavobacterium sp. LB1P62]|uniref:glycosyltransferase n=1 Tax=Flavobacterium sp. LB1P62 TaxID=3401715 RepID=UPI003AAFD6C7